MSIFLLVLIVIEGLVIWGSKCHQNNFHVVCDGYVKYMYEEAEVDRSAIMPVFRDNEKQEA